MWQHPAMLDVARFADVSGIIPTLKNNEHCLCVILSIDIKTFIET